MFRTTLTLAAILAASNAAEFGVPRKGGYGGVEHGHRGYGGPGPHGGLGVGGLRGGHGGYGGPGLGLGHGGYGGHGVHDAYDLGHGAYDGLGHGALAHDGYALGHNGHVGLGDYGYGGRDTLVHGGYGHGLGYGRRGHQILGKKKSHKKGGDIQSRLSFFGGSQNTIGNNFGSGLGLGGVSGFGSDFFGHDFQHDDHRIDKKKAHKKRSGSGLRSRRSDSFRAGGRPLNY